MAQLYQDITAPLRLVQTQSSCCCFLGCMTSQGLRNRVCDLATVRCRMPADAGMLVVSRPSRPAASRLCRRQDLTERLNVLRGPAREQHVGNSLISAWRRQPGKRENHVLQLHSVPVWGPIQIADERRLRGAFAGWSPAVGDGGSAASSSSSRAPAPTTTHGPPAAQSCRRS